MSTINPEVQKIQAIAQDPAAAANKYRYIAHDKSQHAFNLLVGLCSGFFAYATYKEENKIPSLLCGSFILAVVYSSYSSYKKTNQDRDSQVTQIKDAFDPSIQFLIDQRKAKGKFLRDTLNGKPAATPGELEAMIEQVTKIYDGLQEQKTYRGNLAERQLNVESIQALTKSAQILKSFETNLLAEDIVPLAKEKITTLSTRARFFLNGANPGGTYVDWEIKGNIVNIKELD